MTPADVSAQLAELSREMDATRIDLARLDDEMVRAKLAFDVAYARAWLGSEGSVEARKQMAILDCETARLTADIAATKHRACQEQLRSIRSRLDVGRTLSAAIRTEYASS